MRLHHAALLLSAAMILAACGGPSKTTDKAPASAADADKFAAGLNDDLRKMVPYLNAAQWLQATYITDDSQMIASKANEEFLGWQARRLEESKRFNGLTDLKPETARAIMLLKNVSAPTPSDPALQAELAKILSKMEANWSSL